VKSTSAGSAFQTLMTLSLKKFFLMLINGRLLYNLYACSRTNTKNCRRLSFTKAMLSMMEYFVSTQVNVILSVNFFKDIAWNTG